MNNHISMSGFNKIHSNAPFKFPNIETNERVPINCSGIGVPPPGSNPPSTPHTPSVLEMLDCINHWTYFWAKRGQFWMFVKELTENSTVVNGCFFTGFYDTSGAPKYEILGVPLVDINNFLRI
ncbi:hypothetical protein [Bacillus cereus]